MERALAHQAVEKLMRGPTCRTERPGSAMGHRCTAGCVLVQVPFNATATTERRWRARSAFGSWGGSARFPQEVSSECVRIYYLIGCNHRQRQAYTCAASCLCADKQAGMWCKSAADPSACAARKVCASPGSKRKAHVQAGR